MKVDVYFYSSNLCELFPVHVDGRHSYGEDRLTVTFPFFIVESFAKLGIELQKNFLPFPMHGAPFHFHAVAMTVFSNSSE